MNRIALALLLCPLAAVAAPVPKSVKTNASLDGRWVSTVRVMGRQEVASHWAWEVKGIELATFDVGQGETLTPSGTAGITLFAPDPSKPNELDFLHVSGTSRYLWRGLMKWDGDEFVICFADPDKERPTEVANTPAVYSYYRFKRLPDK